MNQYVITLNDAQLGAVLNALADKPYRDVAPVISDIDKQLKEQAAERQKPSLVQAEPAA